jgi:hypothetical protein
MPLLEAQQQIDPRGEMMPATTIPVDAAGLDLWLRAELRRRLTIAVIEPVGGPSLLCQDHCALLAIFSEVRVVTHAPPDTADTSSATALLAHIERDEVDALLVWTNGRLLATGPLEGACTAAWQWPRTLLTAAEHTGLLDRGLVALIGEDVTQAAARKIGYEDGFSSDLPVPALVGALARDAIVRETYRRRGSSPPCYL